MSALGSAPLIQPQDLFVSSTISQATLGQYAETPDGRGYRYAKAGGVNLVAGNLQQASAEDTSNLQNLAVAAAAIGATQVVTTSTVTLSANQAAGGLLTVTTSTGAGYTYRISGHAAASAAVVTFNLEDPLIVALTTSSKIDVIPSPYAGVIVNPSSASSAPVGVAVTTTGSATFGWIQTHGPVACLADGALSVGKAVYASAATAGAVCATSGSASVIGYAVTGAATTEFGTIFLTID